MCNPCRGVFLSSPEANPLLIAAPVEIRMLSKLRTGPCDPDKLGTSLLQRCSALCMLCEHKKNSWLRIRLAFQPNLVCLPAEFALLSAQCMNASPGLPHVTWTATCCAPRQQAHGRAANQAAGNKQIHSPKPSAGQACCQPMRAPLSGLHCWKG